MDKIEVIVDALARLNGMLDPESQCYKIKNPLLLKSFAALGKHETTPEGLRIFTSMLNGYKAALYDCGLKVRGQSRARLTPSSTITDLLAAYAITQGGAIDNIVRFIRRALQDMDVTKNTPLTYFQSKE